MGNSANEDKLRYACDRCHSQKLRCPRSVEPEKANPEEPCSRCRKAGVPCVVSLRGKVGRPSKATKKKSARSPRATSTPEAEFPPYDINSVLSGEVDGSIPWASPSGDRMMDMFDLASGSGSVTTSASPKTMAEDYQPEGQRPFPDPLMGPGLIQVSGNDTRGLSNPNSQNKVPYEPFLMEFDTDADYPTFCIPPSLTDMPAGVEFNQPQDKTFNPSQMDSFMDVKTDESMMMPHADMEMTSPKGTAPTIDPVTVDPRMSFSAHAAQSPGDIFASDDFEAGAEFSSTASYQKLSDLNLRILQCGSTAQAGTAPQNSSQLLKDVVGFSGELIDIARQSMPHFVGCTRASSRASTTSKGSSMESDDGDGSTDTAFSQSSWGSFKPGSAPGPQATSQSVPESAVIFLLLGCYTQILHLFELTTNCLWAQHCEAGQPAPQNDDTSGTIGSLLEASIAIHTVTYLLSRLHRALAAPEMDASADAADSHGWKKSFVGGKELEDGLLGRAFGEIREREQWLMRRTKHLQQRINKCHI